MKRLSSHECRPNVCATSTFTISIHHSLLRSEPREHYERSRSSADIATRTSARPGSGSAVSCFLRLRLESEPAYLLPLCRSLLEHDFLIQLAHHDCFFLRRFSDLHFRFVSRVRSIGFNTRLCVLSLSSHFLTTSEDRVAAVFLIPLCDRRFWCMFSMSFSIDSGVVGAERNLALLSTV